MAIFQPRVAPVRYRGFSSILSVIRGCGPEQFRLMECGFRQAFSQDRLLNLPLQVLQQQPLCAKWRTLSGKTPNKIHVGISPFDWFVWGFCHVKLTQYLRGCFLKKKSYTCCFEVNYHKLYINRKVMNCRFRTKISTMYTEPSLRS